MNGLHPNIDVHVVMNDVAIVNRKIHCLSVTNLRSMSYKNLKVSFESISNWPTLKSNLMLNLYNTLPGQHWKRRMRPIKMMWKDYAAKALSHQ